MDFRLQRQNMDFVLATFGQFLEALSAQSAVQAKLGPEVLTVYAGSKPGRVTVAGRGGIYDLSLQTVFETVAHAPAGTRFQAQMVPSRGVRLPTKREDEWANNVFYDAVEDLDDRFEDAHDWQDEAARKIQKAVRGQFTLDDDGRPAVDPVTYDMIPRGKGILLNTKWYSRPGMADTIRRTGRPIVPHSVRSLTRWERNKIEGPPSMSFDTATRLHVAVHKLQLAPPLCSKDGASGARTIGDRLVLDGEVSFSSDDVRDLKSLKDTRTFFMERMKAFASRPDSWHLQYVQQLGPRKQRHVDLRALSANELISFANSPSYDYMERLWDRARETAGLGAPITNSNGYLIDS